MSSAAQATKDEVVAWMKAEGRGYKAAARHFGLPVDRVRHWGRSRPLPSNTAEAQRAKRRARAQAQARAPSPPGAPANEPDDLEKAQEAARQAFADPDALSLMGPVDYWRSRLVAAARVAELAVRLNHTGSARDWERMAHQARGELDGALSASLAQEEDRRRRELRDPTELARSLLSRLPQVLSVAADDDLARETIAKIKEWMKARGKA